MSDSENRPSPRSPLIHVVDDDDSVRRSLGRLLGTLGLRSRGFSSGAELVGDEHCLEAQSFILDVHMPGMSGYELARRLAARGNKSPIIFITANSDETEQWRTKTPRAIALLKKPFTEQHLLDALDRALGERLPAAPT